MGYFRPLSQTKFINDANLVSYWKLDGNSNDSKSSNNGTDTSITYSAGNAVNTDFVQGGGFVRASASIIDFGSNSSLSPGTSDFTISCWVKLGVYNQYQGLITSRGGNKGYGISMLNDGKPEFFMGNGIGAFQFSSSVAITDTTNWHHIVMTRNGNSTYGYIDGVYVGTYNYGSVYNTTVSGTNKMIAGRYYADTVDGNNLTGALDDIAIFFRALSAGEVAELYQSSTLGEYLGAGSGTTKLLLHLNVSSADSSGNGNNGTDTSITYSQANGYLGQGAGFNGSSSIIYVQNKIGFSAGANNITFGGWFNVSSAPALNTEQRTLFAQLLSNPGGAGTRYFYRLLYQNSGGTFQLVGTPGTFVTTLATGTWYHIMMTSDTSNNNKLYLNGRLVASNTTQDSAGHDSSMVDVFAIGATRYTTSNTEFFNGKADEVICENTTWSAEKIKQYYTFAKGRFGII